jgi:cytochrome c biogenesis protein CcmG, thiol:disulfide interchange protein DsbE
MVVAVVVGGMVWLLAYGFTRDPRFIESPLIGRQAPPFTLTLFDGGTLRLEDLRGKAVLVNFWASWCVPCRAEAPALQAAWEKYKDRGVVFVGIAIQDREENSREFLREFGLTYLNGRDATGEIAVGYGVWGIPETFFIDADGGITYKHVGEIRAPTILAKLDEALQGIVTAGQGKSEYIPIR